MNLHNLKLLLCKIRHRYVAWESTVQYTETKTPFGVFTDGTFRGYTWQEMCSRCLKTRWTAGFKKPKRVGAGNLAKQISHSHFR